MDIKHFSCVLKSKKINKKLNSFQNKSGPERVNKYNRKLYGHECIRIPNCLNLVKHT
jgi:hypothetical protein